MRIGRAHLLLGLAPLAVAALAAACSSNETMSADEGAGGAGGTATGTATGTTSTTWTPTDAGVDAPPEEELESSFGAPVATGRYVWSANPASGRVAYIDAETLEVRVVEAGNAPTFLAAVPDPSDDVAIVLNVLSRDATVLRATPDGELSTQSLPVPPSGNSWAVSAAGRWATAWTDARGIGSPDPLDGYQDIAVLDLAAASASSTSLTVGYRPMALAYDAEATRLFAVTEDGISVVALDGVEPVVMANVVLGDDPLEDPQTRDVSITPDGALALVRREGQAVVTVVSLDDGERTDVELPAPITDLDLSADGTTAVAVLRETGQVALLPIPEIAESPESFGLFQVEGTVIGSVALAGSSSTALLYTNAVESEVLTAFDYTATSPEPRSIALHAAVEAVFPTPEGHHAIVLHHQLPQTSYVAAFSIAPIADVLPSRIVGLDAPAMSVAISPDGAHALLATGNATYRSYAMVVAHMPSLQVETYPLASQPLAAGIVAGAQQGYVAQAHPDGRITFVGLLSGVVRTLTGFELASQVVNGSQP